MCQTIKGPILSNFLALDASLLIGYVMCPVGCGNHKGLLKVRKVKLFYSDRPMIALN